MLTGATGRRVFVFYTDSVKKALLAILLFSIIAVPTAVFAAGLTGPLVPGAPSSVDGTAKAGNQYTLCDLRDLANNIITFAVAFSVIVATLMFAYGGILYLTAASNEANIKKAHAVLLNAVLGILIILLAWLLVSIVVSVLTGNGIQFWTGWFNNCSGAKVTTTTTVSPSVSAASSFSASDANLTGSCVATSNYLATQVSATSNCKPAERIASYGSGAGVVNTIEKKYGSTIDQCASEQGVPPSVLVAISGVECSGGANCTDRSNTTKPCERGGYGATQVSCDEVRAYCKSSTNSVCTGVSGLSDSQLVSKIQSNTNLSFCTTSYAMKRNYNQYGDWGLAAGAYNGGSAAVSPSTSCPGYTKMQCPIADSSIVDPYCKTTCAYTDIFKKYKTEADGTTGMNFQQEFERYMALAEASALSHE